MDPGERIEHADPREAVLPVLVDDLVGGLLEQQAGHESAQPLVRRVVASVNRRLEVRAEGRDVRAIAERRGLDRDQMVLDVVASVGQERRVVALGVAVPRLDVRCPGGRRGAAQQHR